MEIVESITWVTLGFLPMFGCMEVAWRLGKKRRTFKKSSAKEGAIIKKMPIDVLH
jgi:hypothetical protein